jgi:hypothetical protein
MWPVQMSGVKGLDELSSDAFRRGNDRRLLIDADDADHLAVYVEMIDAALDRKHIDVLHVVSNDGSRVTYRPAHRLRFWRSIKPLATA